MRVLALADRPPPLDPVLMARQCGVDAVFCLGDLDRAWIEDLSDLRFPLLGVHGNHDPEGLLPDLAIEDMHLRRTQLGGDVTVAGFEGCVRYRRGAPHQYGQREARRLARRLPAADVLICHCPPAGINDDPDDAAHRGFEGLREWVDRHRPRHVLHGHTHPQPGQTIGRYGETRVHYVSGAQLIRLD